MIVFIVVIQYGDILISLNFNSVTVWGLGCVLSS